MFPWEMVVRYIDALSHCKLESVHQRRRDRERLQSSAYRKGKILIAHPQTLAADTIPMANAMLTLVLLTGYKRASHLNTESRQRQSIWSHLYDYNLYLFDMGRRAAVGTHSPSPISYPGSQA